MAKVTGTEDNCYAKAEMQKLVRHALGVYEDGTGMKATPQVAAMLIAGLVAQVVVNIGVNGDITLIDIDSMITIYNG
jgi:hypothetical protein